MNLDTKENIKNNGATFTPQRLADFLASLILKYSVNKNPNILDPACGDGELLGSIANILSEKSTDFNLTGYDSNQNYIDAANNKLNKFKHNLYHADFLETNFIPDESELAYDIVIANPPYVRTQILGAEVAQNLAKKYNLKGRVDLYYPFLIEMTRNLAEGGILGVITSNRYISTKSGESIREFLMDNFDILEVIDLGDTKLFDAAVLPAIFIGKKKVNQPTVKRNHKFDTAKFLKIYEDLDLSDTSIQLAENVYTALQSDMDGIFEIDGRRYKKTSGTLLCSPEKGKDWTMLDTKESTWIKKIDKNAKTKIGDLFKVRVGIKTTADKVFIRKNWDDPNFERPENELVRELISQENIQRWTVDYSKSLEILYPHYSKDGKKFTVDIDKYPKAKKYLEIHAEKLKSRKYVIDAGRAWYEIWVPHNPDFWDKPKLVFPDISNTPRFHFDKGGKLVNGNCYWIMANTDREAELLYLIQGIANSKLMTMYHDLVFNNKLYSGRRRYFTQFVERYPLPDFNSPFAQEIIGLVKQLHNTTNPEEIALLEDSLETAVCASFGVN